MNTAVSTNHTLSGTDSNSVPSFLIREVLNGEPIYYKGYQDVLIGTKAFDEVMGDSAEKLAVIEYLTRSFLSGPDRLHYRIITNDAGLMIDQNNDLSGDIQLFDAKAFPTKKEKSPFAVIPPSVHIEIDTHIESDNLTDEEYIQKKIKTLLNFGTTKVIWIFSDSKTVLIATKEGQKVVDWWEDINLTPRFSFNLGTFLQELEAPAFP